MRTRPHIFFIGGLISTAIIPVSFVLPTPLIPVAVLGLSICALLLGFTGLLSLPRLVKDESLSSPVPAVVLSKLSPISEDISEVDMFESEVVIPEHLDHSADSAMVAVYQAAIPSLFASIVKYLTNTSEPMSETLVQIKTLMSDFQHEVRNSKKDYESSNHASDIKDGIHILRSHITEVTQETSRSFSEVSTEIKTLDSQMMSILEIVASISDVAERIHVLSINASIEAARAGPHGRGFKVIADEVQRLSRETQSFVSTIGTGISGTKTAFSSLHTTMERGRTQVERFVMDDTSTYMKITDTLDTQLAGVMELYTAVMGFIGSLEMDMSAFAPLGMLHAIVTQEIENLELLTSDIVAKCAESCPNKGKTVHKAGDSGVVTGIERLRSRLTTSRELDALEAGLSKAGFFEAQSLKRSNTEIEFF